MIPSFHSVQPGTLRHLEGIIFDIDDTFTLQGKIPATAFSALWKLWERDIKAVPVTGRPAGWCDHIARMWPVDGVIGENGAFYFWFDESNRKLKKRFIDSEKERTEKKARLARIREEILASVPGTAVSADQAYREADLAIDYTEDVTPLGWEAVDRICETFTRNGARCKVSSIHVNGWFGDYDKLKMTKIFAAERWGLELDSLKDSFLFCGDSPNDEPMFRYFPFSVGVGNVLRFAEYMKHLPAFVVGGEGGEGFAEIVDAVLRHS